MPYSDKAQVNEDLYLLRSKDPDTWNDLWKRTSIERRYTTPEGDGGTPVRFIPIGDNFPERYIVHGLIQEAILKRSDPTVRGEHDTWGCITQVNNGKIWVYVWENWENEHFGYYNDAATGILNCYLQVITRAQSTS